MNQSHKQPSKSVCLIVMGNCLKGKGYFYLTNANAKSLLETGLYQPIG
jgi:hypothetical protein